MANPETLDQRPETQAITQFRDFYQVQPHSQEIPPVDLVSSHDPTIRFTNSTTSVMKPNIKDGLVNGQVLYLAQPAMGTQGLRFWEETGDFGPFASYFISLGSLYDPDSGELALNDALLICEKLGIRSSDFHIEASSVDSDLIELAGDLHRDIKQVDNPEDFRHTYGEDNLSGRNLNFIKSDGSGEERVFCNLTQIELEGEVRAFEVSFDSTTLTAVRALLGHPVESHLIGSGRPVPNQIPKFDFGATAAALLLEGMQPKSKGRSGILRKFMRHYIKIALEENGNDLGSASDMLKRTCVAESEMRKRSMHEASVPSSHALEVANQIIDTWLPQLAE